MESLLKVSNSVGVADWSCHGSWSLMLELLIELESLVGVDSWLVGVSPRSRQLNWSLMLEWSFCMKFLLKVSYWVGVANWSCRGSWSLVLELLIEMESLVGVGTSWWSCHLRWSLIGVGNCAGVARWSSLPLEMDHFIKRSQWNEGIVSTCVVKKAARQQHKEVPLASSNGRQVIYNH